MGCVKPLGHPRHSGRGGSSSESAPQRADSDSGLGSGVGSVSNSGSARSSADESGVPPSDGFATPLAPPGDRELEAAAAEEAQQDQGREEVRALSDASSTSSTSSASESSSSSSSASSSPASSATDRAQECVEPLGPNDPGETLSVFFPAVQSGPRRGYIRYNPQDNSFCAHCPHGSACRLTRTANARGASAQGRPLGLLSAFLLRHADVQTTESHKALFASRSAPGFPDVEERSAGRAYLKELPGGNFFLECERGKRPGEGSEPENL